MATKTIFNEGCLIIEKGKETKSIRDLTVLVLESTRYPYFDYDNKRNLGVNQLKNLIYHDFMIKLFRCPLAPSGYFEPYLSLGTKKSRKNDIIRPSKSLSHSHSLSVSFYVYVLAESNTLSIYLSVSMNREREDRERDHYFVNFENTEKGVERGGGLTLYQDWHKRDWDWGVSKPKLAGQIFGNTCAFILHSSTLPQGEE